MNLLGAQLITWSLANGVYNDKSVAFKAVNKELNQKMIKEVEFILSQSLIPYKKEIRNKTTLIKVRYTNSELKFYYGK